MDPLSKMSNVDIQIWLEGDIYLNVDKMSRAAGLEVRMPLTDTRIFSIASRMPSRYKSQRGAEQSRIPYSGSKKCFRKKLHSARNLDLLCRSVSGWRMSDTIRMCVTSSTARWQPNSSIWMRSMRFFEDYIGGNSDNWRKVWAIYTFLVWYEEYFVKR